jgi:hypothetical protein
MKQEVRTVSGDSQLITGLNARLAEADDAETAIAVYRLANWLIGELDQVRRSALDVAEHDLDRREVQSLKTPVSTAGWRRSDAGRLDEKAWRSALERNHDLAELQHRFEVASIRLREAQRPYMEPPPPEFIIH